MVIKFKNRAKLIFIFIIIIQLTKFISSDDKLNPCTYNDFSYKIQECRNKKRNILFEIQNRCDQSDEKSKKFTNIIFDADCEICQEGEYITYNFDEQKQQCQKCPQNTYSTGGNFYIRSDYKEWKIDNLMNKFQNYCFITDMFSNEESENCEAFKVSDDGKYIHSNKGSISTNYEYVSLLSLNIYLNEKGKIYFKYQKDTLINGNYIIGLFRFFINYLVELEDYNVNANDKWKEVSFDLEPGDYTFLWQFAKEVKDSNYEDLQLKISDIKIYGIGSSNTQCIPCRYGISMIGSDHCDLCGEGQYYDIKNNKCLECPKGTTSPFNSIGVESCKETKNCTKNDYILVKSGLCNKYTKKEKIKYVLASNSKCKEVPIEGFKLEDEIDCNRCPIGQFMKEMENGFSVCTDCEDGYYKDSTNNSNECKQCIGILNKINYLIPSDNFKFDKKIHITNDEGEIKIFVKTMDPDKNSKIYVLINKNDYKLKEKKDNYYIIPLVKGSYNISIETYNVILEKIEVKNSNEGGGYSCGDCISGYLKLEKENYICAECRAGFYVNDGNNCVKCPEGTYKSNNNAKEKCKQCPLFTKPNNERTGCITQNYLENSNYKLQFNLKKYINSQNDLCKLTSNLCFDSFYGPIREKNSKNLYFISFNQPKKFMSTDFSYDNDSTNVPSYIFMLKPSEVSNDNSKNLKTKINLGRDIEYVKLVSLENKKGIIIKYINGDTCIESPIRNYSSFIFLNCSKSKDEYLFSYQSPKILKKAKCNYYFEWSSPNGCPICLLSQVTSDKLSCSNYTRSVHYHPSNLCVIDENENRIAKNELFTTDQSETMLLDDIDYLKEAYSIEIESSLKVSIPKEDDKYLFVKKEIEPCSNYDNFDKDVLLIIIIIPTLYVVIVILCIIFCCKYRRISGDYMRLMEEPHSTVDVGDIEIQENKNNFEVNENKKDNEENNQEALDKEDEK